MRKNYLSSFYEITLLLAITLFVVSNVTAQTIDKDQDRISGVQSQNEKYFNTDNAVDFRPSISEVTRTIKVQDSLDVVFGIYPNPVSDYFTITGFDDLKVLEIYDRGGKKVRIYHGASLTRSISVGDLENGVYWIKGYFFPKESVFRRVIVKH